MMKLTHQIFGAYAGAAAGWVLDWSIPKIVVGTGVAVLFAGGALSPDMDQFKWFRTLDKWIPDEVLGHGGPLGHRRITHFWGIPMLIAVLVAIAAKLPASLSLPGFLIWVNYLLQAIAFATWIFWAALIGWTSHLLGDFIFGKACWQDGRGPGIPLWPWWGHVGVGLDAGGRLEGSFRFFLFLAPAILLFALHRQMI